MLSLFNDIKCGMAQFHCIVLFFLPAETPDIISSQSDDAHDAEGMLHHES